MPGGAGRLPGGGVVFDWLDDADMCHVTRALFASVLVDSTIRVPALRETKDRHIVTYS